jgi:hypothetical protein
MEITQEQRQVLSGVLERFLRAFGGADTYGEIVRIVVVWGPDIQEIFEGLETELIRDVENASDIAICRPWLAHPSDRFLAAPTAHQCAARFVRLCAEMITPSLPPLRATHLVTDSASWIERHKRALTSKVRKLDQQINYGELMALEARVARERAFWLRGSDGRPSAEFSPEHVAKVEAVLAAEPGIKPASVGKKAGVRHQVALRIVKARRNGRA